MGMMTMGMMAATMMEGMIDVGKIVQLLELHWEHWGFHI